MELKELFLSTLIGQVRALDQFGTWANKSDEDLLNEKYVKTKEELKNIPIIADIDEMQVQDIRLIYQAIALAFEKLTSVMCSVVMEMSHEGFGRVVVFADDIVLCEKYFKDAHRFSFRTFEKLEQEGEKNLIKAQEKYKKYKS
ncbi:NifX-associated nitrogen fixation protein [Arcobacter sp. CECT 8985]|uniref:NifX-associated nitrogen fixation protein n=1 Tax=Arcobacter sp. CECT 8985 TaxID=1935424 RepID=UPI00100C2D27|nr:NifX-associated nitrogen fixation protein [Arcobacter sp. CECT 8985]RXJ87854.1 nitrogen fixation protein [Arcobacter sp. CECT 8985]